MHWAHLTAAAAAFLIPLQLGAQEWTYQTYWEGKPWGQNATFKLTEGSPGQYHARFILGAGLDDCWRRAVPATVLQQADEQIIILHPALRGCPERRVVLKTDGSGGRVEDKEADGSWKWDGFERILKRK